ncbi:uncharacterized protein [Montipora capricornis]|uniref:uncharacterized protein n=1 Tax=Montipora capricornis TaxID=246305 RepID=UPI0035F1B4F3
MLNLLRVYFLTVLSHSGVKRGADAFDIPKPTETQAKWLDYEVGAIVHFNMQTYDRSMKAGQVAPADTFNPTELSTDQWVQAAKSFGAKYIIFTIDHFSGFLMWPSETNYNYSVKHTKWRKGNGDVLLDFMRSSRKYNLEFGVFYSVHNNWYIGVDNYTTGHRTTQDKYQKLVEEQMRELFGKDSPYKDPFYIWFDAGIVPGESPNVGPIIRELAANSLCDECPTFAGNQGLRWVGNENALAPLPHWYAVPKEKCSMKTNYGDVIQGNPWGELFCPANCDTVIREHFWFWEPDTEYAVKSVQRLLQEYLTSVGHGCTLLLNINPDTRGKVPEIDLTAYEELGDAIKLLYKDPVTKHFKQEMSVGKEKKWNFKPFRGLNGSVILMEDVANVGQLVMEYELKIKTKTRWVSLPEAGNTIGHKRIHPFPKHLEMKKISAISLKINKLVTKQDSVTLREVSVYNWDDAAKRKLI